MDEFSNFDPEDDEFYASIFVRRLRAVAQSLFEGKKYGDYSPEDLLSDTLERFYVKRPWKRSELQPFKRMYGYTVQMMRNIHLKRVTKLIETDSLEVVPEDRWSSSEVVEKTQKALEEQVDCKGHEVALSWRQADAHIHRSLLCLRSEAAGDC